MNPRLVLIVIAGTLIGFGIGQAQAQYGNPLGQGQGGSYRPISHGKVDVYKAAPVRSSEPLTFAHYVDHTEAAFSMLMPLGWRPQGGIVRFVPGMANLVAGAKVDFAVQRQDGLAEIRLFPRFHYYDFGPYPILAFPEGTDYNGMTVRNLQSPEDFALTVLIPEHRPDASNVRVVSVKTLAEVASQLDQHAVQFPGMIQSWNKAVVVTLSYDEQGRRFREQMCVILNYMLMQRNRHTIWCNEHSFSTRALESEYDVLERQMGISLASARVNPEWLVKELVAQWRKGEIAVTSMEEIYEIQRKTMAARRKVQSRAAHEWSMHILGVEDYLDPRMNTQVRLPNNYPKVWADGQGTYILTESRLFNPNEQQSGDWRLIQVAPQEG